MWAIDEYVSVIWQSLCCWKTITAVVPVLLLHVCIGVFFDITFTFGNDILVQMYKYSEQIRKIIDDKKQNKNNLTPNPRQTVFSLHRNSFFSQ